MKSNLRLFLPASRIDDIAAEATAEAIASMAVAGADVSYASVRRDSLPLDGRGSIPRTESSRAINYVAKVRPVVAWSRRLVGILDGDTTRLNPRTVALWS